MIYLGILIGVIATRGYLAFMAWLDRAQARNRARLAEIEANDDREGWS